MQCLLLNVILLYIFLFLNNRDGVGGGVTEQRIEDIKGGN
jgi:hypothetical protein